MVPTAPLAAEAQLTKKVWEVRMNSMDRNSFCSARQPWRTLTRFAGDLRERGGIIRVDPLSGVQTPISSGGNFNNRFGITLDAEGNIFIADTGSFFGGPSVIGPEVLNASCS